jgi:hypothetical protein
MVIRSVLQQASIILLRPDKKLLENRNRISGQMQDSKIEKRRH